MNIAIAGIGRATAEVDSPAELPWEPSKWNVSRICYPAVDSSLTGVERWRALVKKAFADLGPVTRNTPLFVGSCNGDASRNWEQAFDTNALLAGTPWADEGLPVFSSSCASGIHALYAAKQLLTAGAVDEALVLAADILSQTNHDNFESLRVLAETPSAPWQPASQGFILGEAAVVLKLVSAEQGNLLHGPELGSDLVDHDGLASALETVSAGAPSLLVEGIGPYGHTVGASGLLSIALAYQKGVDGRPLRRGGTPWPPLFSNSNLNDHTCEQRGGHGMPPLRNILVTCRALNGACAATIIGGTFRAPAQRRKGSWRKSATPGPMSNQVLKRLASEALEHRPPDPPDVLILRMDRPLSPPPSVVIGGRLLPSAVLEITPGFASQLVARCWGFSGPSLCLVGDVDRDPYGLTNALNESGLNVFQVTLRGSGENRVIEWNV